MANGAILDRQGIDVSHQDRWQVLDTKTQPEDIAQRTIGLSELLQGSQRPDVLVPLTELLDTSGAPQAGLVKQVYELIIQHSDRTGLWVSADTDTSVLTESTELLLTQALIVIHVPAFADGRNFSFARTLRQLGYQGDIRVTGQFGRDQIAYLLRVGVDSFVVSEQALSSVSDISQAFSALASSYDGQRAADLPMFAGA